jgi:O-antigen biosynthesis protein
MGTATSFLALALARMGHSVEILLGVMHRPESIDPYWADVYDRAGVKIRGVPPAPQPVEPWPFLRAHSNALALRDDPPDVVIAHDFAAPAYAALRLRQAGVAFEDTAFVVFCHGSRRYALDLSPNLAPGDLRHVLAIGVQEQASIELADVVVSPSAYLLDWMRRAGWLLPECTQVIPYFSRGDVMDEPRPAPAYRDGTTLERLTFFGRLDERKGLKLFAAALNAVEPDLLAGLDVELLGRPTATWTRERIETLFSAATQRALRRLAFETQLDQHEALARLRRPGTLVIMPSLGENSPNTVYECLEHGIPFIASNAGGIPELVAPDERARVLFEPTTEGLEAALRGVLSGRRVPPPPQAAFDSRVPFERWAEVMQTRPRRQTRSSGERVDVVVVQRASHEARERCLAALERQTYADFRVHVADTREAGLRAGDAPNIVFLDEEDVPDPELLETLVRAQAASGADVVTCGVRLGDGDGEPTLHFFSGDPGGLGVLANDYGLVCLLRRAAPADADTAWAAERDPAWPFLAGRRAAGASVISVPAPLVTRTARIGTVEDDAVDALLVVHELERTLSRPLRGAARLPAGLAANVQPQPTPARNGGVVNIALRVAAAVRRLSGARG